MITGKNYIGGTLSAQGHKTYKTINPILNTENETNFVEANTDEINAAVALAESAYIKYNQKSGSEKAAFLNKLQKLGLKTDNISDVLALDEKDVLERRLQTIIFRKKMASTVKQARQLIVHKYVIINGSVVNTPSFWVTPALESQIEIKAKKEKIVEEIVEEPTEEVAETISEEATEGKTE